MSFESKPLQQQLFDFVEISRDGYAIFDADDHLKFCNQRFAELMDVSPHERTHWADILRTNFSQQRGIKVDSGDIETFVRYTQDMRRSRPSSLFEVDFFDGRRFLYSEQTNADNELLMHVKEITKQKVLEDTLREKLSSLEVVATTDELTRVGNRRALIESVNNELSRCRRTGASMSMLLIDLDHFKHVNDTYGHQAGDQVLREVASVFKAELRTYDILGRIGGEEFAIFLSNTTSQQGLEIGQRVCASVADTHFEHNGQTIPVTVSIGLTTLGCDAIFENLYEQADEALYRSKANGRNQVTAYT